MITHRFHMRNHIDEVDRIVGQSCAAVCGALGVGAMARFEICMAEALTNLVQHAGGGQTRVDVVVREINVAIGVDIFDPEGAAHFDICDHATALCDVDPMTQSGRGLGLIKQCADDVFYGSLNGRNRLFLMFLKVDTRLPLAPLKSQISGAKP